VATKKQKREAALAKRAAFLEENAKLGRQALTRSRAEYEETKSRALTRKAEIDRQNVSANSIETLIDALTIQFGRLPSSDEVLMFVYGTEIERQLIWNLEAL
jgi:hypothetical protein